MGHPSGVVLVGSADQGLLVHRPQVSCSGVKGPHRVVSNKEGESCMPAAADLATGGLLSKVTSSTMTWLIVVGSLHIHRDATEVQVPNCFILSSSVIVRVIHVIMHIV